MLHESEAAIDSTKEDQNDNVEDDLKIEEQKIVVGKKKKKGEVRGFKNSSASGNQKEKKKQKAGQGHINLAKTSYIDKNLDFTSAVEKEKGKPFRIRIRKKTSTAMALAENDGSAINRNSRDIDGNSMSNIDKLQ